MKSRVYTKGGDKGQTSLLGGRRVPKYHLRIESYGTIDELMAHTALLRDMISDQGLREELLLVLDKLMSAASIVAADGDNIPANMPVILEEDIRLLEISIDRMDTSLGALTTFVLPGGHPSSSQAHITRTICRRCERLLLKLSEKEEVEQLVLKYFNRLSDYYFLISRYLLSINDINEIPWKP